MAWIIAFAVGASRAFIRDLRQIKAKDCKEYVKRIAEAIRTILKQDMLEMMSFLEYTCFSNNFSIVLYVSVLNVIDAIFYAFCKQC